MALTGDLEHLHIVDIIQLINTTRKSGTFSVKGRRGESCFIFSNGYLVGASHLNNRIRIGNVLLKMNAIDFEDLEQALEVQKSAGRNRKPLLITLIELGKLTREDAERGLRKLIEMTLVELIGWTEGSFTLDTDVITVSPECSYPLSRMEQEVSIDAQMILMDALRVFDERERDRQAGKTVLSDEEVYADVISQEEFEETVRETPVLTADDLGLNELDQLERKMPLDFPSVEIFDPAAIHRQKIKDILTGFSSGEQDAFVSFLEKSAKSRGSCDASQRKGAQAMGLILFSEDELLKHSVMTICKDEGVLVFSPEGEEELGRIIAQCLAIKVLPVLVFDCPEAPAALLSREKIVSLRRQVRERYPQVPLIQVTSLPDDHFTLQSFRDGMRAVFPKPSKEARKETFISDMIQFLEIFASYITDIFDEQKELFASDNMLSRLKERVSALRDLGEPADVSLALLQSVSELCDRSITFIVRPEELTGEKAIGVYDEKNAGPTSVTRLKVSLSKPSVFRDVIEKGQFFYGESDDEVANKLFEAIGAPLSPAIILLPVKSYGKTLLLIYGDFGGKEAPPLQCDALEILAHEAGLVLENLLYRKQPAKAQKK
ncbi:MAG: DUF4388 domain-containing protein [Nitrospirota bacterium]|nr:DUF4388 domain-containing protein [Nitrospirota bacterium]